MVRSHPKNCPHDEVPLQGRIFSARLISRKAPIRPSYNSQAKTATGLECPSPRWRICKHGKPDTKKLKRFFPGANEETIKVTKEAEALVRWRHPEHGLLGPLEFLPEVEEFNLIGPVSEYVLRETVDQLVLWREQGLKLNACINLASSLLIDPELPDLYARIVRDKGLECASFTFEVAEQDVLNSEAPHLRVLNRLRALGFRISLDDFGVAASSLSTFEQLPVDEIKIHRAAVVRARENPVAQKVLAAVTGLAHKLGISVCAEGVEDPQTLEFLKTIECDKMQGFLISEAVIPSIIRRVYSSEETTEESSDSAA